LSAEEAGIAVDMLVAGWHWPLDGKTAVQELKNEAGLADVIQSVGKDVTGLEAIRQHYELVWSYKNKAYLTFSPSMTTEN